ncbi:MAG: 50S ribosomal protein L6 [Microgenomates group bacterium]
MSKIGKQSIEIPQGVTVDISGSLVKVSGPKGNLEVTLPRKIEAVVNDGKVEVSRKGETKQILSLHGTFRSLINNMVKGVSTGWSRQLELIGTGFRAEVSGNTLTLIVGYSHPVKIEAPAGVSMKVEKMIITVEGANKEAVGQVAANIRGVRPPEPYKGKGIKYVEEIVRRKPGKAAAKAGAPA